MGKRHLVVDQNLMRRPLLETLLFDDPELQIVIPDLAFLEMTKTDEWESTLANSLAILARYRSRVHVCLSLNEALRYELHSLSPVGRKMYFPEATNFVRDLLMGVQTGRESEALMRIRENPDGHLQNLAAQHLNHLANKESVSELVSATSQLITDDTKKRLRAKTLSDSERIDLLFELGQGLLPQVLGSRGVPHAPAVSFARRRPMTIRYIYLKAWRCVRWIADGGLENRDPDKVTNDELDDQYILAATFFSGLLSWERTVNEAYRDLKRVLARTV
jgi:hypothetical protein